MSTKGRLRGAIPGNFWVILQKGVNQNHWTAMRGVILKKWVKQNHWNAMRGLYLAVSW